MKSKATLRMVGDSHIPDEVTRLFGCPPTGAWSKGEVIRGKRTGSERISRVSIWYLEAEARDPADIDGQIAAILDRLNPDAAVWASLSRKFRIDLFCGLFIARGNDGLSLSPASLAALGNRGIELSLDIYDANDEADNGDA